MGIGRSQVKSIASTTVTGLPAGSQGDVLYHNGSDWVSLSHGTTGQVLTTNGGSANPSWTNKTSATGIVGGTDRMVQFNDGGSDFGGVEFFEFRKDTNNLMVSGSAGYSFTARASGSSQTTSGIDVYNYDDDQVLQVGHNNLTTESYIWATQTSNNLKFGTNNTKRMEILASNGKVFTSNDLHVSGTLTAGTATLIGTDTLWNAKGDLAVGTGSDTAIRVAIGSDGKVLTADSSTTSGVDWVTPAAAASTNDLSIPVGSSSGGGLATKFVSSPFIIDPVGGPYASGNVVMTSDGSNISSAGLGRLALITETGSTSFASVASGAAATVARLGSITNHTSTVEFLHNGKTDILSKIVMTSGTTTIGAESPHKFILTGGLGITAQSSKPTDSTTKPALWVSGTSNLLYLSDVGMVTANSSVLSAGYVPYVSGATKNGVGNSVIYNDATNSRVGINTASPNRPFDVRGTSLLSGNTKVVGTGEITSTLDVGSNITGTGTATFKTASLTNIVLDPSNRAAFIKLQDSSRTATTASRNPEILLNQILTDSGTDKADFPTIRFSKAGPVAADMSYTNLGYRIYVSGETGAGSVNAPQAMIWDFNSDVSDPLNYTEKLALTTDGGLRINNAYTLPTAAPAGNGYVITGATDGTTAWVANSGGGGGATFWSEGSSNKIYYNSGNVGIGTTSPDEKLDVRGDIQLKQTGDTAVTVLGDANRTNADAHVAALRGKWNGTAVGTFMVMSGPDTTNKDDGQLTFQTASAGTLAERMRIDETGSVGIGTTEPSHHLHVVGNGMFTGGVTVGDSSADTFTTRGHTHLATLGNNVGIGTTGPNAKLEVRSTSNPQIRVSYNDSHHLDIYASNGTGYIKSDGRFRASSSTARYFFHGNATSTGRAEMFISAGGDIANKRLSSFLYLLRGYQGAKMELVFTFGNTVSGSNNEGSTNSEGREGTQWYAGLNYAGGGATDEWILGTDYRTTSGSGADGYTPVIAAQKTNTYGPQGKVGINILNPQQPLHVLTSANDQGILIDVGDDAHEGRLLFGDTSSNAIGHIGYNHSLETMRFTVGGYETVRMANDGSYSKLFLGGDSTLGLYRYSNRMDFYISSNPRMHLDASKLYSATSGGPLLDLTPTAGEANYAFVDDADSGLTRSAANTIHLLTAGVSGMTMDSSQNVGIGTPEPPEKLYVSGGRIGSFETNREILVDPYVAVGGDNQYSGILGQEGLMLATPGDSYLDLWVPDGRYVSFRSATGSTSDNATTYISGTRANSEYIYFKPTGTAYNKSAYVYARNELQLAAASNMSFNAAGSLTIHIDDDLSVYNPGGNSNLTIRQDSTAFYELQADDDFVWKTANTNQKMILTSGGRLGINTTSPGSQLHVSGTGAFNNTDGIRLGNITDYASLFANNSHGGLTIDSPHSMVLDCGRHMEFHAGGTTREHRYMYATTQYGFMTTADANSYWAIGNKSAASAGLLLSGAAGGIRMVPADGNVTVVGTISATAKSFDIPHPDKEGMRLVHGSLEGPEHGVYARGTAKGHGETTIELPDYWKTLVGNDYTLQLTSYNSSNVYIVDKKEDSFTVDSNALTYKFDYVVIGRREEIEVEQDGN